jgi:hypothetical protein
MSAVERERLRQALDRAVDTSSSMLALAARLKSLGLIEEALAAAEMHLTLCAVVVALQRKLEPEAHGERRS